MLEKEIDVGSVINVAGFDFIVLDKLEGNHYFFQDYVLCLSKDVLYKHIMFSKDSADYSKSEIRKKLKDDFLPKLIASVGEENILNTEISLMSSDGTVNYGTISDKVGILTVTMYKKYETIIKQHQTGLWWWLATQNKSNMYSALIVAFGLDIFSQECNSSNIGVRPFVAFNSKIFST